MQAAGWVFVFRKRGQMCGKGCAQEIQWGSGMSFVNELVPEADKQRIDWTNFRESPFTSPIIPWKWTIDRSRDAYFLPLAGQGPEEGPEVFMFVWKANLIRLEAWVTGSGAGKWWDTLNCVVTEITIPDVA